MALYERLIACVRWQKLHTIINEKCGNYCMLSFIAKRILSLVPVILIVSIVVFLLLRLSPGDPAVVIAGDRKANPAARLGWYVSSPANTGYASNATAGVTTAQALYGVPATAVAVRLRFDALIKGVAPVAAP